MKKSKGLLSLALAFMLILGAFITTPIAVYANEIRVTINGEQVTFPYASPANVDGRTLVPVRAVFEALDFSVSWDIPTQTATLTRGNDEIIISIGNTTFTTNGISHNLDVPAAIIGGSTMVPIRLPLESVGYYVDWNGATNTVVISSMPINAIQSTSRLPDGRFTEEETIQWMLDYRETGATAFELRVVELINEIRAEHGLGQVTICETLMMSNRLMSQLSYYCHFSLDENAQLTFFDDPFNNIDRAFGFGVGRSAIVIGLTADMLVNEMMTNWRYAFAILNPDNRFIGVGRYGSLTGAFTLSMRSQNAEFPFRTLDPNAPMVTIGGEQFSIERRAISLHYRLFSGDSLTNNDIASLQYMPHLVSLRLGRSSFATTDNITDLSPLAGLTGLTHLTISNVAVENISPLAGLTNLTELRLSNNRIADVSPLRNLTNLTYLDLTNNSITSILPLAGLTSLTTLTLERNFGIEDITPIAGLTNLTDLNLSNLTRMNDITPLEGLTNLTNLNLDNTSVDDITPLAGLTNLTSFSLSNNRVGLQQLEARLGGNTEFDDIPPLDVLPLARLTNLTHLSLASNQIVDISPLTGLVNLTSLRLSDNQIVDISPLAGLTNLSSLTLQGNQIIDWSPVAHVDSVSGRP